MNSELEGFSCWVHQSIIRYSFVGPFKGILITFIGNVYNKATKIKGLSNEINNNTTIKLVISFLSFFLYQISNLFTINYSSFIKKQHKKIFKDKTKKELTL